MSSYVIGVDVGTSGSRAVIADEEGSEIGAASARHHTMYPRPSWAEQSPEDIYDGVVAAVREVMSSSGICPCQVVALCMSTVFHSFMLLDTYERRLTDCIVWLDTRSTDDANAVFDTAKELYMRTGCPANSSYPLSKAAWFRRNLPDTYRRVGRILSIKDYLIHRLTGEYMVDQCVAGGSGFLNVHSLEWDESALSYPGAKRAWFSPIVPATTVLEISSGARAELGLHQSTKLVVGAGDGLLASIGSGSAAKGSLAIMMGTSGACRVFTDSPRLDSLELQRTWSYPLVDGIWATGTSVNNCGSAHEWVINMLFPAEKERCEAQPEKLYAALQSCLDDSSAGAGGLSFLPWVSSERGPYWPSWAKGGFVGLTRDHSRADLYRSAVEGIVCLVATLVDFVEGVAGPAREVRSTGGFTNSEGWMRILASIVGRPVFMPEVRESVAYGACLLALAALGCISDIESSSSYVQTTQTYLPIAGDAEVYRALKRTFQQRVEDIRGSRNAGMLI